VSELDLADSYREFCDDLILEAESTGDPKHHAFFRAYASAATDNGDCPDLEYTPVRKDGRGGYQVDGIAVDVERGELFAAVCDYRQELELQQLHASDIKLLLHRTRHFCELAMGPAFVNELEETSPAFGAAYPVFDNRERIKRIRVIVFSNARLATRKPPKLEDELFGIPIVCNILDFTRFTDIERANKGGDLIEVDVEQLHGSPLACLPAHAASTSYEAYLIAMPGELLAKIYGLYGARLLEQNVRTFLQARTKVNAGIIRTLSDAPEMFFAYNNGLTATASGLKTSKLKDGSTGLVSIQNLQIVNGGQTTASLLYARDQNKVDLSRVFLQMKLSVVRGDLVEQIVPRISRYANTQNRISEADFASSDAFHVAMEKISRRLSAPPKPGALSGSRWFYERARGQYKDAQAYTTPATRKKFELMFPKSQVIEKTELAKYEMTWQCAPHIVSLGAQKCFLQFSAQIGKEWAVREADFDDGYYRDAAAKALLFCDTDQMVGTSDWYQSDRGYKAQIVTYSIAWLLSRIRADKNQDLNLSILWQSQEVPDPVRQALRKITPLVAVTIKDTPDYKKDVGEYCKLAVCWTNVSKADYKVQLKFSGLLKTKTDLSPSGQSASIASRLDKDIELDDYLLKLSREAKKISSIARERGLLSPKADSGLEKLSRQTEELSNSERNAVKFLLARLEEQGFELPAP
jgi:hypothetical protein